MIGYRRRPLSSTKARRRLAMLRTIRKRMGKRARTVRVEAASKE